MLTTLESMVWCENVELTAMPALPLHFIRSPLGGWPSPKCERRSSAPPSSGPSRPVRPCPFVRTFSSVAVRPCRFVLVAFVFGPVRPGRFRLWPLSSATLSTAGPCCAGSALDEIEGHGSDRGRNDPRTNAYSTMVDDDGA